MRNKVADIDDQTTKHQVNIAKLSGDLGSHSVRANQLEKLTEEHERSFAASEQELEVEIGALREERDAWQRRMKSFASAAAEAETELGELDELVTRGVQERRQLQAECLSLQQECEDARVELQETRDILRQAGSTVERMVRQKLELEWELQEQTTKHKVLRTVLEQSGHHLAHESEEAHRQRETLIAAGRCEIEKECALAESFRCSAVADQRELTAVNNERVRLEREATVQDKEVQRLEGMRLLFEEETLQEHHLQGVTNEVLESGHRRRDMIAAQLEKLETQGRDHMAQVADVQEERAKLLFANAQRQAVKVLAAETPVLGGAELQANAAGAGTMALTNVSSGTPGKAARRQSA